MPDDYPTSVRLPKDIRDQLKEIAKKRGVSPSQIIVEACIQYIDSSTPGLCPFCHTQNAPDARYCQKCGEPLTEETMEKREAMKRLLQDETVFMEMVDAMLEKKGFEIVKKS